MLLVHRYTAYSGVALAFYFALFGFKTGLVILGSLSSFCFGSFLVLLYFGKLKSDATYGQSRPPIAPRSTGIPKLVAAMDEQSSPRPTHYDKRLTGAHNIDEQLQETLDHIFTDYIKVWYNIISDDQEFLLELRKAMNKTIASLSSRTKEVDWTTFVTQTLVDELASHVKLYRRADQKVHQTSAASGSHSVEISRSSSVPSKVYSTAGAGVASSADENEADDGDFEEMERQFFEFEKEMEGGTFSREVVCSDPDMERRYLQDLTEALLYFLLPDAEFDNQMCRFLIREVLVNGVIFPLVDSMAEPDYINQRVIWLCDDSTLTSEAFISTLRLCDSIPELQAVLHKVSEEIARTRSKDTGGADDMVIKRSLSSLNYVKRLCEARITRIARLQSSNGTSDEVDALDVPDKMVNFKLLPFECVFNNDICMQYFNDFLISSERAVYLNIVFDVECYNKIAIPQLVGNPDSQESQRLAYEMTHDIYEKYFSEDIPGLQVEHSCVQSIHQALDEQKVTARVFDRLNEYVMEKLEKFYEEFKSHPLYVKMLRDLEMDSGSLSSFTDETTEAISTVKTAEGDQPALVPKLSAVIDQTGIVKEGRSDSKPYATYLLSVWDSDNTANKWDTSRRYSDFYDLYVIICDKYPELKPVPFPEKKTFNILNKDFLDKRAKQLNDYLQIILSCAMYHEHASLRQLLHKFLQPCDWVKPKDLSAMKMGAFLKKMSTSAIRLPDVILSDVVDGFGKGFGKIKTKLSFAPTLNKNQFDSSKVGATLDTEDEDNIPMRIMLLLMDEVFDLRKKNQWLRRRIVAILRQIIKAAYGDRINKRIVENVETLTSVDQVTEYIRLFKESFWPSGLPAEKQTPRDKETKLRTSVVCKAKMIGSIPDDLRRMIGSETTKLGVLRVFTMFQHKRLNKRLIYTILEAVIRAVFEHSSFETVFKQMHSRSELRGRADSSLSQSTMR